MRCFLFSSFLFSVYSIYMCVCECECMSIYIYIYLYVQFLIFSATKDMIVKILIDLFFLFFFFWLSIFFRQVAPIDARSANNEKYVRASRISLYMNMDIWLDKKK
jgi:hypothetical protein